MAKKFKGYFSPYTVHYTVFTSKHYSKAGTPQTIDGSVHLPNTQQKCSK